MDNKKSPTWESGLIKNYNLIITERYHMLKTFMASVKTESNEVIIIKSDYRNKQDFIRDLRGNGYKVRVVSLAENFDTAVETYHRNIRKARGRA